MDTKTVHIDFIPIAARSLAFVNPDAVERFYSRSPAVYEKAAMQGGGVETAIASGRAEQQIIATHALGILRATESMQEIDALCRAVDRATFDKTLQAIKAADGQPVALTECAQLRFGIGSIEGTAHRFVLAILILIKHDAQIEHDETYSYISQWIANIAKLHGIQAAKTTPKEREAFYKLTGEKSIYGFSGAYDCFAGTQAEKVLNDYGVMFDVVGIDLGDYTDGIKVTDNDAALVLAQSQEQTALNIAALITARAIKQDKKYCVTQIRRGNPAAVEAAKNAQENAEVRASAAEKRIAELEDALREAQREAEKQRATMEALEVDAQELASLREAIWKAAQGADEAPETVEEKRELPGSVIVVGGHPAWARRLAEQLPGVRCWASGTSCPANVIAAAKEIWIQAAYMAHKDFYAVINIARANGIAVHYFSGTGVKVCVDDMTRK